MDRIVHPEIEQFKTQIYGTKYRGMTVGDWNRLLSKGSEYAIKQAFTKHLNITEEDAEQLLA